MIGLKDFAIPFGLLMMGLWTWLLWSFPKTLIMAFVVTVAMMVVIYRNEQIVEVTLEPRRVLFRMEEIRKEVFAKVDELRRLAKAIGELTAYNVAHLWRLAPDDPEAARLEERERITRMLREAGIPEADITQLVSKITEMVTWDLAGDVWRAVPKDALASGPARAQDLKVVRRELVDRLLRSQIGSASAAARQYLEPLGAWKPGLEELVHRFDEFRRTGVLPARSRGLGKLG